MHKISDKQRAAMDRGRRRYHAKLREQKKLMLAMSNGHAAPAGYDHGAILPGKKRGAASGRELLVALARPMAVLKIAELEKEIETLRVFLAKTAPSTK